MAAKNEKSRLAGESICDIMMVKSIEDARQHMSLGWVLYGTPLLQPDPAGKGETIYSQMMIFKKPPEEISSESKA